MISLNWRCADTFLLIFCCGCSSSSAVRGRFDLDAATVAVFQLFSLTESFSAPLASVRSLSIHPLIHPIRHSLPHSSWQQDVDSSAPNCFSLNPAFLSLLLITATTSASFPLSSSPAASTPEQLFLPSVQRRGRGTGAERGA